MANKRVSEAPTRVRRPTIGDRPITPSERKQRNRAEKREQGEQDSH